MTDGRSKSKCGQSDENNSWVSALIISMVTCNAFMLLVSIGCVVYQQCSRMYSLGTRLSSGASDGRIRYWSSRRCMRNGTQASPLSTQIDFNFGKRSGMPLQIQLVMWTMLHHTKPSACMPRKRLMVASDWSCQ